MNHSNKPFGPIDKPVNATNPNPSSRPPQQRRPQRPRKSRRRTGIRSFIIGSATTAIATTALPMLINTGPFLFTILAGCFFFFRGCLSSTVAPTAKQTPTVAFSSPIVQPAPVSGYASATHITPPRPLPPQFSPPPQQVPTRQFAETFPSMPPPIQQEPADVEPLDESQLIQPGQFGQLAQPTEPPLRLHPGIPMMQQAVNGIFGNLPPQGAMPLPLFYPAFPPQNDLFNALAAPPNANQAMELETSPLFSFHRGRKFIGTSQMPSQPSRRISLSIEAIREGGKNIAAQMSTLDGRRITKPFIGLIEQNPLRLILRPVTHPTSFGITLPHEAWHSISMAVITLHIAADGKSLTGTSSSNEEFQLLPQFDISGATNALTNSEPAQRIQSFDEAEEGSTTWKITRRNNKALESNAKQTWVFTRTSEQGGDFQWTKGDTTLCSGIYREQSDKSCLEFDLSIGSTRKSYHCRYAMGTQTIRICVPSEAGAACPSRISTQCGTTYGLIRTDAEKF